MLISNILQQPSSPPPSYPIVLNQAWSGVVNYVYQIISAVKCRQRKNSRSNVHSTTSPSTKRLSTKRPFNQKSFRRNVCRRTVLSTKSPVGKTSVDQMSCRPNVCRRDVHRRNVRRRNVLVYRLTLHEGVRNPVPALKAHAQTQPGVSTASERWILSACEGYFL